MLIVCLCYYADTNECGYNNGGCAQNCHNIIGSYFCTCNGSGYTLNSNRHTCDGELNYHASHKLMTFYHFQSVIMQTLMNAH